MTAFILSAAIFAVCLFLSFLSSAFFFLHKEKRGGIILPALAVLLALTLGCVFLSLYFAVKSLPFEN